MNIPRYKKAYEVVISSDIFKTPTRIPDLELLPDRDPANPNLRFYNETTKVGVIRREYPIGESLDDESLITSEGHPYVFECPPTDCNPRSGGKTAPLRVNLKSGPNGPSLGTQAQDLCALKCSHSHLLDPLRRM